MKTMFKFLSFAAILAVGASPAARADTYDSSLTQGPGVYFAHTTTNSGFDRVNSGNVELGLEAITRGIGPITPSGNTYKYTPGTGTAPGLSTWDFEFSVNTGPDALDTISSYSIKITDNTNGHTATFDPTTLPDNGQSLGGVVQCHGTTTSPCPYNGSNTGFQNAENLGFGFLPGFDPNAYDSYTIELSAGSVTDTINVVPTPEPSSLIFLGTGLVSAAGTILRRRRLA